MCKMKDYFRIDRADNCIWLTDLRELTEIPACVDKETHPSMHFTPEQACNIGVRLIQIAHGAKLALSTPETAVVAGD